MSWTIDACKDSMKKTIASLQAQLAGIAAGRATPELLSSVSPEVYGQKMRMNEVASIAVIDNFTLLINPYDTGASAAIERAIRAANLGLSTSSEGGKLKVRIPRTTEETRRTLVKEISKLGEGSKISIRNIRRDAMSEIKKLESISLDVSKGFEKQVDDITSIFIAEIDAMVLKKSDDILTM